MYTSVPALSFGSHKIEQTQCYVNFVHTCRIAALASNASAESVAIETRAVGVPVAGMAAGERRGVDVINSSGGVPYRQKSSQQGINAILFVESLSIARSSNRSC